MASAAACLEGLLLPPWLVDLAAIVRVSRGSAAPLPSAATARHVARPRSGAATRKHQREARGHQSVLNERDARRVDPCGRGDRCEIAGSSAAANVHQGGQKRGRRSASTTAPWSDPREVLASAKTPHRDQRPVRRQVCKHSEPSNFTAATMLLMRHPSREKIRDVRPPPSYRPGGVWTVEQRPPGPRVRNVAPRRLQNLQHPRNSRFLLGFLRMPPCDSGIPKYSRAMPGSPPGDRAGLRSRNPRWIRKGSTTSSRVPRSSPTAAARVSSPTGPPSNFSISVSSSSAVEAVEARVVHLEALEGEAGVGLGDLAARASAPPRRNRARGAAAGWRPGAFRASAARSRPALALAIEVPMTRAARSRMRSRSAGG